MSDVTINLSVISLSATLNAPTIVHNVSVDVSATPFLISPAIVESVSATMFGDFTTDFEDNYDMPNGYITKCNSSYDTERKLFDNVITESINQHGVCMDYYVTTYDTSYDRIFGEDNNRRFERKFSFMGFFQLPKEDRVFTKFGIEGMDTFSIFVSKLHFKDSSTFGNSLVPGNKGKGTYGDVIPKIGDILRAQFSDYLYIVTEVKEEQSMFLLSKQHIFELIVKPFKDEYISLSNTTSASMSEISAFTDKKTDIYNIKSTVDTKKANVVYTPKATELPSGDPFNSW